MSKRTGGSLPLAVVGLVLLAPAGFISFVAWNDGVWIGVIPLFMFLASAAAGVTCLILAVRGIDQ